MRLLTARFPDREHARSAITALENAGIDGDDIKLVGRDENVFLNTAETKRVDRRIARALVGSLVRGTLTGIAVGVVSGLVLALALALTTDFAATAGEVVACVLLGAWIAGTAGAFVGLARAGTFSDAWARTFEDLVPGPVWLGVRCHDATEQAHAVRVLRREGAGDVTETHDHAG